MAGVALAVRFQGRGFWRRMLRREQARSYLVWLTLGGGFIAFKLPALLSRASGELAAGQTASTHQLLIAACLLWLLVLGEVQDGLTSARLRRFPLAVRELIAIRILSLWLSPLVWMVTVASILILAPFRAAPHPLLGILCAGLLYAVTIGVGMNLLALRTLRLTGTVLAFVGVAVVLALAFVQYDWVPRAPAGLARLNPASLVTTAAMATTPVEVVIPLGLFFLLAATAWSVLPRTFPRTFEASGPRPFAARRGQRRTWLPGRLGPIIQREHRSVVTIPDWWMAFLPVLVGIVYSFTALGSTTLRLSTIAIACALNMNLTSNCLGMDRPGGLTRYVIFPIRGWDLLLAKNVGVACAVAIQVAPLLAIGVWMAGAVELGAALIVAGVSLLGHLAWGNVVSVSEPRRAEPYSMVQGTEPVTVLINMAVGGAPGAAVLALLSSASWLATLAIAAIALATLAWYYRSLMHAGVSFERGIEIISKRLA